MDKYIGRLLDNRYEILEVIGTGGMAVVYKARCHRLNRLVAIKILKDDYLQDEEFRRRFHSESQAVAMLSHPNIVSVYDVSTSIMADYIVMELIEGLTLKQYMEKKGILNWKETLHFAIQIAKALEHAHGRGIVHRDIKPHNVMVLKNGSVKVMDFGIARMMSQGNTLTKEALGSVHYISPEQAKGGRVDSRSDIYSLGVVMYEMMAGRPPYDGESPVAVAIKHINGGAPLPSTLNPNIPGGLEQIIMKAMGHELHERYVSATRMLSDMDEFRKDPTILFDYNTPPLDAVTKMTPPPLVLQPDKTTADKVANRGNPPRRRTMEEIEARRKERAQEAQRQQKKKEESRNRMATIAIISCAVVALVAIVVVMIIMLGSGGVRSNPDLVEVPDLEGQVYKEIINDYPDLSLISNPVYDDSVPEGYIISQKPNAGDKVVKGTKVVLDVSRGPAEVPITMPKLEGMKQQAAENHLNSLSLQLRIEIDEVTDENTDAGLVINTFPAEGVELKNGDTVILVVSLGKAMIPEVQGKTPDQVREQLRGFNSSIMFLEESVYDETVPEGKVVRTEPGLGEELKAGQTVKLYISKGPAIMPDLSGYTLERAKEVLDEMQFDLKFQEELADDDTVQVGCVIKTEPLAEEKLTSGQTITLYICKEPVLMPDLSGFTLEDAEKALNDLQIELKIQEELTEDPTVTVGCVIKTEPLATEKLTTGQTVVLYICKAPEKKMMPDVVGKDVTEATQILVERYGFKEPVIQYVSSDLPKDQVLKQSHEAHTEVELTAEITLEVSTGPVTKDLTISLEGCADTGECVVIISRDGTNVLEQTVPQGTQNVTLPGQVGSGNVTYQVQVVGMDGVEIGKWSEVVTF